MTQQCHSRATKLTSQAHTLHQELKKAMRCFGRQCRGQGHVFVKLVRQTEQKLLALGEPITALGQQAQQLLDQTTALSDSTRERLADTFNTAMSSHTHIRKQSTQLTQGKKLRHCKLVNAYDLTIAPILKGKSNGPAQFGRKPGIASDPATGFIFANRTPQGNPSDASDGLPLIAKVQSAIERVQRGPKRQIHSVASDLGLNDPLLRQAFHARGMLTVGIPRTIEPIEPHPSARDVFNILTEAGFHRKRPPIKCTEPVPVALVAPWWKATSRVCSHAVQATCVTKALRGR